MCAWCADACVQNGGCKTIGSSHGHGDPVNVGTGFLLHRMPKNSAPNPRSFPNLGHYFSLLLSRLAVFPLPRSGFWKKLEPSDRLGATDSERDESYRNFLRSFDLLIETYCLVPFMSSVLKGKAVSTFWPLAGSP